MTEPKATMADWLALHGLTTETCREILALAPLKSAISMPDQRLDGDAAAMWGRVAMALAAAMPDGAAVIGKTLAQTRTDFLPRRGRAARAFTLHDDGSGRPFVRCAYDGSVRDFVALAHEFGHACQILACATAPVAMPPVMREVCACLSEILVISHLIAAEPDQWPAGPALIDARTAQNLDRPVRALFKALEDALAPYCYSWNYPLARILALRGTAKLSQLQLWQIFRGEISLAALIRTLGD